MTFKCDNCKGEGWVCECHANTPWTWGKGCCGGAGMPCPVCRPSKSNRSLLIKMVAALVFVTILGVAYHAFASTAPRNEPEKAKDASKPIARCIQVTTVQRFLMKPDGTMLPISGRVPLLAGC